MLDTERSNSYVKDPENHYSRSNSRVWINQVQESPPDSKKESRKQSIFSGKGSIIGSRLKSLVSKKNSKKSK